MSNIGSNINLTGANIGKLNLGTQTKTMMQNCSNVATGDNITFNIGTEKGTNRQGALNKVGFFTMICIVLQLINILCA